MARIIGKVQAIIGKAAVKTAANELKALHVGDSLHENDMVYALGENSKVTLHLEGGRTLSLNGYDEILLDSSVFTALEEGEALDVKALQQALADELNLENLDETAAGETVTGSANAGADFETRNDGRGDVSSYLTGTQSATGTAVFGARDAGNNPPDAQNDVVVTNEDTPVTINVLANDSDADGDTITITGAAASNGTVTINEDGTLYYNPNPNYNGSDTITYSISDGRGGTDTATVDVTVNPVNDLPDAQDDNSTGAADDALTTPEDTPLTINPAVLLANDIDIDGDILTIASVQGASNGSVQIVDGNVVFTPDANYNGPASFTYTVDDGNGGTDTATVYVTVTPVNDNPDAIDDNAINAANDALTTAEDTPLYIASSVLLANDSDVDGDPLTITSVQNATHGTVSMSGDTILFTPVPDYNGSASFTYTIIDGQGGTDTATVYINVTPVNDPADLSSDKGSVTEDYITTAEGTLTIHDTDSPETFQPKTTTNEYGTFTIDSGGNWKFDLANNAEIVQNLNEGDKVVQVFTVRAADGTPTSVTITINGADEVIENSPPETEGDEVSGDEGTVIPIALVGSDVDGDVVKFVIQSVPTDGDLKFGATVVNAGDEIAASGNQASLTFEPTDPEFNGTVSFQYYSVDDDGAIDTSPATIYISVNGVNDEPTTDPKTYNGTEDNDVTITLSGDDVDGTVTKFTINTLPTNGTLLYNGTAVVVGSEIPATGEQATLTFRPDGNWYGDTNFTYSSIDNLNLSDATPDKITINIASANDEPTTDPKTYNGTEDNDVTITLSGDDVDGTVTKFTINTLPTNGTLYYDGNVVGMGSEIPATGEQATLTFRPDGNWYGDTNFTYSSIDNLNLSDATPDKITINIASVNDAPEAVDDNGLTDVRSYTITEWLYHLYGDNQFQPDGVTIKAFDHDGEVHVFDGVTYDIKGPWMGVDGLNDEKGETSAQQINPGEGIRIEFSDNIKYAIIDFASSFGTNDKAHWVAKMGDTIIKEGYFESDHPQMSYITISSSDAFNTIEIVNVHESQDFMLHDVYASAFQTNTVLSGSLLYLPEAELLANDTDPENNTLNIIQIDTTDTVGSVTMDANGNILYDPTDAFDTITEPTTDTFKYLISDGAGGEDWGTVTVTVMPPVASGIEYTGETLLIGGDHEIDLSNLVTMASSSNISQIDLTPNGADLTNVSPGHVDTLSNSSTLVIDGDSDNTVTLTQNDWTLGATVDGYTTYTADGGVTLVIDQDVNVVIP